MVKFSLKLTVTEFFDSIEVEADSREEAEEKLARMWEDGELESDGIELDFQEENEQGEDVNASVIVDAEDGVDDEGTDDDEEEGEEVSFDSDGEVDSEIESQSEVVDFDEEF